MMTLVRIKKLKWWQKLFAKPLYGIDVGFGDKTVVMKGYRYRGRIYVESIDDLG